MMRRYDLMGPEGAGGNPGDASRDPGLCPRRGGGVPVSGRIKRLRAYAFGLAAEARVAFRYRLTGHRILAHRFRSHAGEVDLVARRGRRLVFIEVKARRTGEAVHDLVPATAIRRIKAASDDFLTLHPRLSDADIRFDLAVVGEGGITVYRNAL